MEPLPKRELAALLGSECFLRKANADNTLFVTDAPRRFGMEKLGKLENALAENGFIAEPADNGLWLIDMTAERYRRMLASYQTETPAPFPDNDRFLDVYALAELLGAHPAPWAKQPLEMIRTMLKHCAGPTELPAAAPGLLETCAVRLRGRQPLPYNAAGLLRRWLKQTLKEGPQ